MKPKPQESNFDHAQAAVERQWAAMSVHPCFRVEISGDELWNAYLGAFPDGANPIFRKRTEHDCSCCKSFIRTMGNVVAVIDGTLKVRAEA